MVLTPSFKPSVKKESTVVNRSVRMNSLVLVSTEVAVTVVTRLYIVNQCHNYHHMINGKMLQ